MWRTCTTTLAAPARAESLVTILGVSPLAACANAAADARRTGIAHASRWRCAIAQSRLGLCRKSIWPSPTSIAASSTWCAPDAASAIADTHAAIRLDATLAEAWLDRGIALSGVHRSSEAIRDFAVALHLNIAKPELAYFDRAMAREDSGDLKGAYADYRHAADLNPAGAKPREELARFTVGSRHHKLSATRSTIQISNEKPRRVGCLQPTTCAVSQLLEGSVPRSVRPTIAGMAPT
ncbi:MAG: hypothetical protein WDN04_19185 [Rhodospirillales bacterium]